MPTLEKWVKRLEEVYPNLATKHDVAQLGTVLGNRIDGLNHQINNFEIQMDGLNHRMDRMQTDIDDIKSDVRGLQSNISDIKDILVNQQGLRS